MERVRIPGHNQQREQKKNNQRNGRQSEMLFFRGNSSQLCSEIEKEERSVWGLRYLEILKWRVKNDSDRERGMASEICMEMLLFLRKETHFTKIMGGN